MRKILVAIPYLNSGGVEVSLIRFLNELSKNEDNKIDLLMLKKEGMYLKELPKNINIIETSYDNDIYSYERKINDVKEIKRLSEKIKFLIFRLKLKRCLQKNDWSAYYKLLLTHVKNLSDEYDLAIDWHGYGHFITSIVAEKISARKKAFWIHDEKNEWIDKITPWLDEFNKIYCVGVACKNNLLDNFPFLQEKTDVFYNMTDYEKVREKALGDMEFSYDKNKLNIVTVGRLEWQKAYDVAVLIAKKLKEKKVDFCWYVIGVGHKKKEIEDLIKEYDIADCFKLLGVKNNPFPYVKNADIYVLSSRHEGYCLATLEAKILGKVIVATDIPSNREQITNYENGILCELDSEKFAYEIISVMNNPKLKKEIEDNLAKENFDYTSEFEKLYKLMEE